MDGSIKGTGRGKSKENRGKESVERMKRGWDEMERTREHNGRGETGGKC